MLTLSPAVRVFVATGPVDLRKGIPGLFGLVRDQFEHSPYTGHWYVFFNRRKDLVKVFCWGGNGFAIYLKKLARGCFPVRFDESLGREEIDAARLLLLLEGIELQQAQWRPRWQPPTVDDEGRRSMMTL